MKKVLKRIFFPDKWNIAIVVIVFIAVYFSIQLDDELPVVKEVVKTNEVLSEKIGRVTDIKVRKIIGAKNVESNLPYERFTLTAYGERGRATVVVYIEFTDFSEENIKSIHIEEIQLLEE